MKRYTDRFLIALLFFALSFPFLLISFSGLSESIAACTVWEKYTGIVVRVGEAERMDSGANTRGEGVVIRARYFKVIRYSVGGKEFEVSETTRAFYKPTIGAEVSVYVSPENSQKIKVGSFQDLWLWPVGGVVVSAPFFLIGLFLLINTVYLVVSNRDLLRRGKRVEASGHQVIVVRRNVANGVNLVVVKASYLVDGVEYQVESERFLGNLEEGQRIEVAYNDRNPKRSILLPLRISK